MTLPGGRALAGAVLLGALIGAAGWLDYRATSDELRAALRGEADALHATVAAAARVQHAAALQAERALGERLLEQAKLLALMDRQGTLTPATLDRLATTSDVFRVVLFDSQGRREYVGGEQRTGHGPGPSVGSGFGRGGGARQGLGPPAGQGPPPGGSRVAQRLLSGETAELVSGSHASRDGGERIAAGVRRVGGGAIVLNAANRVASELEAVYSLDALVSQIAAATPAIAYVILQDARGRVARGPLAEAAAAAPPSASALPDEVQGVPVLERRGAIALDEDRPAELRIGMRLDDVRRAERRSLIRIASGFAAVAALTLLGLAFGSLRRRYGDLSDRHASAQEALRRRDRLAAMGEMASTVAHEIRNPLNAIAMSAQRLAREYPRATAPDGAQEDATELVDVIQRESARIDGTVQQFLDFTRPRPLNRRRIALGPWLAEVAGAATALAGAAGVTLATELDVAPALDIDPDQLRQAIDNLVRNAIDATPPGGVVTIAARRRGRLTTIEVRDTGAGISPDVLPRIFDLYYTTKREGTGVGLAVAQQIVAAHGGEIRVETAPGAGTRMVIVLPDSGVERA